MTSSVSSTPTQPVAHSPRQNPLRAHARPKGDPMKTLRLRSGVGLFVAAAGAAHAQPPSVSYELSWRSIPSGSQVLMYLESAEVKLLARVYPPVGTVIQDASLPGGGTGTIAGLSSIAFDLQ